MARARDPQFLVGWTGESSRARRNESLLAAVVLHLGIIVLTVTGPVSLAAPPAEAVDLRQQELTILTLPPDLAPKPEQENLTPEERRRMARRKRLTLDPDQLPYVVLPEPPRQPGLPQMETQPTLPGATPFPGENPPGGGERGGQADREEPREFARLEDIPRPKQGGDSDLDLPFSRPGRVIEEGLRRGQGGGTTVPPGEYGPVQPNLNTPFPTILSDTRGVDFGPYLIRLLRKVRQNWYASIPESVRWGEQGRVVIIFSILKDGAVPEGQPTVVSSSGRSHLDRPALAAILASQPFPPLPEEFTGPHIVLQFTFLYNLPLDYAGPL